MGLYGSIYQIVGHPFDTIKTHMQVGVLGGGERCGVPTNNARQPLLRTVRYIYGTGGLHGFFKGFAPPFLGALTYRAMAWGSYGFVYAACKDTLFADYHLFEVELRVFLAGVATSMLRTLVESPLEFMKTQRQIQQIQPRTELMSATEKVRMQPVMYRHMVRECARGFSATGVRNFFLIPLFFVGNEKLNQISVMNNCDFFRNYPFLRGGFVAAVCWTLVWPLDVVKSQMQAGNLLEGHSKSIIPLLCRAGRTRNLCRGLGPGVLRAFVTNGAAMFVYQKCQNLRYMSESDSS